MITIERLAKDDPRDLAQDAAFLSYSLVRVARIALEDGDKSNEHIEADAAKVLALAEQLLLSCASGCDLLQRDAARGIWSKDKAA